VAEINYNAVARKAGIFPPSPLPSVILLVGTDDGLKREAVQRINEAALDPAFADFDHETVDLSLGSAAEDMADPVARIFDATGAAPFSSPKRVVTVVSVQKLAKERQEALASLLARVSVFSLILLIADASEMEAGRPKGRQVELSLRKSAAKVGLVLVCDAPEGGDLRARAVELIAKAGKSSAPGVIDALLQASSAPGQSGGDVNALYHETNKLLSYVGDAEQIAKADATAVLPVGTDENIFRLLDNIGARDIPRALHELDALVLAEGKPDATAARLIVMLQRHFRLMMLAKYLGDRRLLGKSPLPQDVKDLLPGEMAAFATNQAYRLGIFAKQAANFRWDELQSSVERILAADLSMKGIVPGKQTMPKSVNVGDDPVSGLRMLVFDLCYRGK
jgi:DNA polymerase III subunit delta